MRKINKGEMRRGCDIYVSEEKCSRFKSFDEVDGEGEDRLEGIRQATMNREGRGKGDE